MTENRFEVIPFQGAPLGGMVNKGVVGHLLTPTFLRVCFHISAYRMRVPAGSLRDQYWSCS